MNFTAICLLSVCLTATAAGNGQNVTINQKNATLEKVFKEIRKQTDYNFLFSTEELKQSGTVTINVRDASIDEVLTACFEGKGLTYLIENKTIIIKQKVSATMGSTDMIQTTLIDVRGIVYNEEHEPVEGATVTEGGTQNATSTNSKGEFVLKNVNENASLIITSVNTVAFEVKLNGRGDIGMVALKTRINSLQGIVVNKGYYSTSKQLNTGNVSKVSAASIEKQPVNNPLQALQGRVSGLQIIQSTGVPGGRFTVRIRGRNNVRPNADFPLYVIDGVPFSSSPLSNSGLGDYITQGGNPLSLINPLDIESIEVLKDGDATSIYGSRGANGVILITTKKGKSGKTRVDVNMYTGYGEVGRPMKLLNTQQYLEMRNEALANDGIAAPGVNDHDLNGTWVKDRYTDWQEVLIGGKAKIFNAQVALSGGTNKTQFYFGGGYSTEGTVFPGSFGNKKGSAHFKLSHGTDNGKFNAQVSATYMNDLNKLFLYDVTNDALLLPPNAPELYTPDGKVNWQNGTFYNPLGSMMETYNTKTNNFISNSKMTYKILPNLQIGLSGGYTQTNFNEHNVTPLAAISPTFGATSGQAIVTRNDNYTWILEPQGEYTIPIGKGKLTALVGATFQKNNIQKLALEGQGFANDNIINNIQAASRVSVVTNLDNYYKYNAVYGRLNYDHQQKYLVNLTARRDGSSRFGPGKQFVNFGAVGVAWVISNENFLKNVPAISFAKIRGSYGTTGSDQIGDYGYLDLWNSANYSYNGNSGVYPFRLFNKDYAWELNRKFEAAFELGLFKDRIYLSTSYYRNITPNQLINRGLPGTTGFASIQENFPAVVENKGVEIELNTVNVSNKFLQWNSNFNITFPKNTLLEFPNIESSSYANTYQLGRSLYVVNRLQTIGVDPLTGVLKFEDIDRDGTISNTLDRTFRKEVAQKYYAGLENSLNYKGFELNVLLNYVKQTGHNYMSSFYAPPGFMTNQPTVVLNRWRKPGDVTNIQRFTSKTGEAYVAYLSASDAKISDASYLRLRSMRIAYKLPQSTLQNAKIQQLKLYIQGMNLFTITKYIGLDPEVQDNFYLPTLRVITGGIQINF